MNNFSVPEELLGFFQEGQGKTLLVKGNPGSGKTIFAFTLLRELNRKGIYLSTRVDPESLYGHIGWLRDSLPVENIVDATQSERQKMTGSLAIKALKYTDVPDFLKGVYERIERLQRGLVIVDSWDAVVSHTGFYEPREREKLEHNLTDFSRKTGTDIIFIAEYVDQRPLDYLVDGVVITLNNVSDMRRVRSLELQKLRGVEIKQPVYLYSLHGGVFRGFSAFRDGYTLDNISLPPAPLPDPGPGRLSTGSKDLDAVINGYGSFNLCQGDRKCHDLLQLFLILNAISLGKKLVLSLSERSLLQNARVPVPENLRDNIRLLPGSDTAALNQCVAELDAGGTLSGAIFFLYLDAAGGDGDMERTIYDITQKGGFVLGFVSEGQTVEAHLESMVATSLVARTHFGIPCIYSNIPLTENYAMKIDSAGGYPELRLTPVV